MKRDKSSPWEFLWYALYAFAGLGLELVLMGGVEPALFGGTPPSRYTAAHTLLHWGMTMACWGLTAALLVRQAEKKLGFSLLEARPVPRKGARLAIGLAALCILLNALDWGTLKVIGEFQKKGPLLFAGQYLYYAFEVVLVLLIAAFGQRFWEALRKGRSQFPFGGVVLCCTWGAIHMLSRGEPLHRPGGDGLRADVRGDICPAGAGCPHLLSDYAGGLCHLKRRGPWAVSPPDWPPFCACFKPTAPDPG